jgi:hypothetical protein
MDSINSVSEQLSGILKKKISNKLKLMLTTSAWGTN